MKETKIVMLGTGTPNPVPHRKGPCTAIVVGGSSYLIDAGVGCVRQAELARQKYALEALGAPHLKRLFLTHLHSDHTLGLPDVIFTPWVLERKEALLIYGPAGTKKMVEHVMQAWGEDIAARRFGLEYASEEGIEVVVKEIEEGLVYEDHEVKVEAFNVIHPPFRALGYRFTTGDKVIVLSGDTNPSENLVHWAKGCDVLIHEVISTTGVEKRDAKWNRYHKAVHTDSRELAIIAKEVNPKTLVFYHQLFMVAPDESGRWVTEEEREKEMIEDVKEHFDGIIISPKDLDIIDL
ncbi:MAG: MBL fold metallo-hydrolase [Tissierellia bacterium]|nr:MBL fold metallo-hydrolase [Tissierellia bacterium]